MRILIATGLFPPDIGGPATYSRFLAEELPQFGHMTRVVSFGEVRRFWPGVRHIIFLFRLLSRGKNADLIYAQDTLSVGLPAALASFLLRKKFLVRVPGDHVWEQGTARFGITMPLDTFPLYGERWHWYLTFLRMLQQWVVKSATAIVVPSVYMRKIVKRWGINPKKIVLIYNGVEELSNTGNKSVLRGLLKFQGKLVVSIGRLVRWKGFDALIKLVPRLKERFVGFKLLIIGNGPLMHELESLAASLGVADDVIFTGELTRDVVLRYIRTSDVFVLNSRYEGLSHQLLEAMSVGVPVVASAVGGNPEVVEDGVSGYLVRPDDADMLTNRIATLFTDATLKTNMVAAAKRTVKRFSHARMVEETAQLLKRV